MLHRGLVVGLGPIDALPAPHDDARRAKGGVPPLARSTRTVRSLRQGRTKPLVDTPGVRGAMARVRPSRWTRPWARMLLLVAATAASSFAVADAHTMEQWSKDVRGATGRPHRDVHARPRVAATGSASALVVVWRKTFFGVT